MFRPELNGKPIVVLSNNDGCAIAMSNEAQALGIPMGAPDLEVYSIDGAFADMRSFNNFVLYEHGLKMKETIHQWAGIPVCIGMGKTKTLF